MSTQDVPGANPANADKLCTGCWAEHADGSLIFVKGTEGSKVVYELFDVAQNPPVSYSDAMADAGFKKAFSYPPVGASPEKWTWHDKTPFPWDRVMKSFGRPVPQPTDAEGTLSAAARVADSLKLRAERIKEENVGHLRETIRTKGREVLQSITEAFESLLK